MTDLAYRGWGPSSAMAPLVLSARPAVTRLVAADAAALRCRRLWCRLRTETKLFSVKFVSPVLELAFPLLEPCRFKSKTLLHSGDGGLLGCKVLGLR